MNIEPIKKYCIPKYPEKSEVLHNPAMLKAIPERWKDNISIGVALSSILALTLTGCGSSQTGTNGNSDKTGNGSSKVQQQATVAPIFEHGGGRGSFGCSSVTAPSFLTEHEALLVIQEEALKYGVNFENLKYGESPKKGINELENVDIPETKLYFTPKSNDAGFLAKDGSIIDSTQKGNLILDGYDADKKIGFEFVSVDDYKKWVAGQDVWASVEVYDVKNAAKLLQKGISNKNGDSNIGVFYDPMPLDEVFKSASEKAKQEGKSVDYHEISKKTIEMADEQLRLQVRDFLEWLKAQGVI